VSLKNSNKLPTARLGSFLFHVVQKRFNDPWSIHDPN
jgi:hypothetical protein